MRDLLISEILYQFSTNLGVVMTFESSFFHTHPILSPHLRCESKLLFSLPF